MKRRNFFTVATASAVVGPQVLAKDPLEVIDIHQHINFSGRNNEDFIAHQDKMGVSRTVLLPSGTEVARASTHDGKSNGLAARIFGTEAAARMAKAHPEKFVYFCNEVPDIDSAKTELTKWLERGACGIGEQKFALEIDSAPMQQVYEIARDYKVPVLLHIQHEKYNMGFERLPKMLEKFPTVNFIGHAQTWWANIDAKHDQSVLYPKTPVTAGGLTDKFLADYPNIFGDLSAGSGKNSITRDLEHAEGFLQRHQDKLCYGTDCSDSIGSGDKCSGTGTQELVRKLTASDPAATAKILSGNAKRIIPGVVA